MQLSHHHNILELRHSKDSHAIETPIKKSKPSSHSDLKTAESPNMQFSASKNSIADVEAEELFDNFSRIVTISESNEEDEYQTVSPYRRIHYDKENCGNNNKLDFDQSTNSMKKKRRGSRLILSEEGECIVVKPFALNRCEQIERTDSNQNINTMNMNIDNKQQSEEAMSPYMKRRASKGAMMSTPTKKPVRSAVELDRAAKKECPFRDLNPKKILFS